MFRRKHWGIFIRNRETALWKAESKNCLLLLSSGKREQLFDARGGMWKSDWVAHKKVKFFLFEQIRTWKCRSSAKAGGSRSGRRAWKRPTWTPSTTRRWSLMCLPRMWTTSVCSLRCSTTIGEPFHYPSCNELLFPRASCFSNDEHNKEAHLINSASNLLTMLAWVEVAMELKQLLFVVQFFAQCNNNSVVLNTCYAIHEIWKIYLFVLT